MYSNQRARSVTATTDVKVRPACHVKPFSSRTLKSEFMHFQYLIVVQPQSRSPRPGAPPSAWRLDVIRHSFLSPLSRKASRATFLIIVTLTQKNNLSWPQMRKLQNIIYEGKPTHHNSGPAFLDAAVWDGEMQVMFDDKMGHCTWEMEGLGSRESGVPQERFWGMRIVAEADPHCLSWTPWSM